MEKSVLAKFNYNVCSSKTELVAIHQGKRKEEVEESLSPLVVGGRE
jgi:hypothetical protein